jgi:hypothetical protein
MQLFQKAVVGKEHTFTFNNTFTSIGYHNMPAIDDTTNIDNTGDGGGTQVSRERSFKEVLLLNFH